jgi:hypothetical protein
MYVPREQDAITSQLLQAINAASKLPKEQQDVLAKFIFEKIGTWEWEDAPELHAVIKEARAEYAAGDYITFEDYDQQRQARD